MRNRTLLEIWNQLGFSFLGARASNIRAFRSTIESWGKEELQLRLMVVEVVTME